LLQKNVFLPRKGDAVSPGNCKGQALLVGKKGKNKNSTPYSTREKDGVIYTSGEKKIIGGSEVDQLDHGVHIRTENT